MQTMIFILQTQDQTIGDPIKAVYNVQFPNFRIARILEFYVSLRQNFRLC